MSGKYKFENFKNIRFPVYSSLQKGCGTLVVPHFHGAAELIWIISGSVHAYVNTQRLICEQGTLLYIPPYCMHSIVSECPDTQLQGIVFDFSLIPSEVCGIDVQQALNKDKINRFEIDHDSKAYGPLINSFRGAVCLYGEAWDTYRLEMLAALCKMTALLLRHYQTSTQAGDRFSRLQPVIDYIRCHFRDNIAVSDLSEMLHVCDDQLIRLFKATTNKTPVNYITDIRLEEAMKLLVETELPVTEVAGRCGFASSCYMARVFKNRLHMTPLEYRKKR